jgi:hypothetical protein
MATNHHVRAETVANLAVHLGEADHRAALDIAKELEARRNARGRSAL